MWQHFLVKDDTTHEWDTVTVECGLCNAGAVAKTVVLVSPGTPFPSRRRRWKPSRRGCSQGWPWWWGRLAPARPTLPCRSSPTSTTTSLTSAHSSSHTLTRWDSFRVVRLSALQQPHCVPVACDSVTDWDAAVYIISSICYSFPDQHTLIVTHCNQMKCSCAHHLCHLP